MKNVQKGQGTIMIMLGWAFAFFTVTMIYHQILNNKKPSHHLSAVSLQARALTIQGNDDDQYIVKGLVNDKEVIFLVDTGATEVAIPLAFAKRIGVPLLNKIEVQTASGITTAYLTKIKKLKVGNFVFNDISAVAIPNLSESGDNFVLLGMNALKELEIVQRDGAMILKAPI